MSFFGLSPAAFVVGLAVLALVLAALHLLRVRLRQQTVDSLIFLRMVGAVHRPRVLPGRPSRLLAFLIGLALLGAMWSAFAEPTLGRESASRVVVVDHSAAASSRTLDGRALADATLEAAEATVADRGLGPRGRVVAFGLGERQLLASDEPVGLLAERLRRLPAGGPTSGVWPALGAAARALGDGDEIVLIGGPDEVPGEIDGVPLRRVSLPESATVGLVGIRLVDWPERQLRVTVAGSGAIELALVADGTVVSSRRMAAAAESGATVSAVLGDVPTDGATLALEVRSTKGAVLEETRFAIPPRQPLPVHVSAAAPESVHLAIAADVALRNAERIEALAVVTTAAEADAAGSVPALVLDTGTRPAPREPRRTAHCPLPLSLRDRARRDAPALRPVAGETVWVEDTLSGAPLVAASLVDGSCRVRVVDWLLADAAHRDVPVLVVGSLRLLGGLSEGGPVPAGAAVPSPRAVEGLTSVRGADASFESAAIAGTTGPRLEPGSWTLVGSAGERVQRTAVPTRAPAGTAATGGEAVDLARFAGPDPLLAALAAAALLLLALDVWLYHRGRIP